MQILNLNFEAELLWQIRGLDQEISLPIIIDFSVFAIIQRQFMQMTFQILMIVLLICQIHTLI